MSGNPFSGTISSGQTVTVGAGQTASGVVVEAGGSLVVESGGIVDDLQVARGGTVVDGGRITLASGDVAYGVDVRSGGVLDVVSGARVYDTDVESGGEEIVTVEVRAPFVPVVYELGVANDTRITVGSVIEVRGFGYSPSTSYADFVQSGDVTYLHVSTGAGRFGQYSHEQTVTGTQADYSVRVDFDYDLSGIRLEVACYLSGTAIATSRGEWPVESLSPGDRVLTASGALRPVRWVGRRSYAGRFLRATPAARPVRFRAGSLGDDLPRRDLLVSPDHAMFLEGVLVPARCLVNGTTVVREQCLDRVDYFHVELDDHDVLLAEGAPSESFLDDDSRGMFHNAAEWARLHPDRERVPAVFCAPRVERGPELEAVRQRLADVAGKAVRAA